MGLKQHVDSLEHMNQEMAQQADMFQASLPAPPAKEEGEIFVQTADGKGVPIRRPADAPPIMDHQHRTGPKPDRKKMATVGAVYSINRLVRTPEEVVESLFRDPRQPRPKTPRPHPCHKQMRAHVGPRRHEWRRGGRAGGGLRLDERANGRCGMPAATSPSCASWTERSRYGT